MATFFTNFRKNLGDKRTGILMAVTDPGSLLSDLEAPFYNRLVGRGYTVYLTRHEDLLSQDFSNVGLVIICARAGLVFEEYPGGFVGVIPANVISMSRYISRYHFKMGNASGASDHQTWTVVDQRYPAVEHLLAEGQEFDVLSSSATNEAIWQEFADVWVGTRRVGYSTIGTALIRGGRAHWSAARGNLLTSTGWALFDKLVDYMLNLEKPQVLTGWTSRWASGVSALVHRELGCEGNAVLQVSSRSGQRTALSCDALGSNVRDAEVLARVMMPCRVSGDCAKIYARGSGSAGSERGYWVEFYQTTVDTTEEIGVRLRKYGAQGLTTLDSVSYAWEANKWYNVRFRIENTELYAKVWVDGEPEPTDWTLSVLDAELPFGWVGIGQYASDRIKWDYIAVGTEGDSPVLIEPPDVSVSQEDDSGLVVNIEQGE